MSVHYVARARPDRLTFRERRSTRPWRDFVAGYARFGALLIAGGWFLLAAQRP